MKNLEDGVAVVTGGGSGIGRGIALAFADAGMRVVVADIDESAARAVGDEVRHCGARALAVRTDVADRASVEVLAERAYGEFGRVHVLCNNAGVGVGGPLDTMTDDDWRWVLSVNLEGVVHGLQAFLPRFKAQAGEKHIVNTASMAGLIALPGLGIYTASKYAVVGISETLRVEGAAYELGVSVLCPGLVRTNILASERNRPRELHQSRNAISELAGLAADRLRTEGMDPLEVGRRVRQGVIDNRLYILTHPELRHLFELRVQAIAADFAAGRLI